MQFIVTLLLQIAAGVLLAPVIVSLVPLGGSREVYGLSLQPPGRLDEP